MNIDKKIEFIKAIESVGVKCGTYKLIFKSKGKYGEAEAWIYKIPHTAPTGTLITIDTIKDKEYLREYLHDFIQG